MAHQTRQQHWLDLIAHNKIPSVLRELREALAKSSRLKALIQQSRRYHALSESIMLGTISSADRQLTENQIASSLIDLVNQITVWEADHPEISRDLQPKTFTGSVENAVIDSQLQAGRDINFHKTVITRAAEGEVPHFLTDTPLDPDIFIGREHQLKDLHAQLLAPTGHQLLLLVNGEGGIGKTTLASAYFHRYHGDYQNVAWVLADGGIRSALLSLAPGLQLDLTSYTSEEAQLNALLRTLANRPAPCLLIIDNANHQQDLDKNYAALRKCKNFRILLTSRLNQYANAAMMKVQPLEHRSALDLFHTHFPAMSPADEQLFPSVYAAVGGNTLVLELLAKNLERVNRLRHRLDLAGLLKQLRSRGLLQLLDSREVTTDYGQLRRAKPEDIIAAMYDLQDLDEEETSLLAYFSLFPPGKTPIAHLEKLIPDFERLEPALESLEDRGWLELDREEMSFRCSPVIQEVVRGQFEELNKTSLLLQKNLVPFFETDEGGNPLLPIRELRPFFDYSDTLLGHFPAAKWQLYLLQQLGDCHRASGDLTNAKAAYEKFQSTVKELLAAFEDIDGELKYSLATSYSKLGSTYSAMGKPEKSLRYFQQDLDLSKQLHEVFPENVVFIKGLAISYLKLGEIYSALGKPRKALGFFQQKTKLFEQLHKAFPENVSFTNGLAISYTKLGETYSTLGEPEKALGFFQQRSGISKQLHEAFPENVGFTNGLAIAYFKLGSIYTALDELEKALGYFQQDLELSKQLHEAFPENVNFTNGLAMSYVKLGEVATDPASKKDYYQKAEAIWAELTSNLSDNIQFRRFLRIIRERLDELRE